MHVHNVILQVTIVYSGIHENRIILCTTWFCALWIHIKFACDYRYHCFEGSIGIFRNFNCLFLYFSGTTNSAAHIFSFWEHLLRVQAAGLDCEYQSYKLTHCSGSTHNSTCPLCHVTCIMCWHSLFFLILFWVGIGIDYLCRQSLTVLCLY